jgi:hypothetical protein
MSLAFSTIRDAVYNLGGIIKPGSITEEQALSSALPVHAFGSKGDESDFIKVAPPQFGLHLASFGASITRTFLIGEVGEEGRLVPLHYSNIASVILYREAGALRQALPPYLEDYVLIPMAKLPNSDACNQLVEYGIPILDTECPSDSFVEMRRAAVNRAANAVRELMSRQVENWREQFGGEGQVLAIAGTLSDILEDTRSSDVIAISDAASVLDSEAEGFVGGLPLGEMTSPFSLDDGRRYFYLRFRDHTLKDPGSGLLRVEFMPGEGVRDLEFAKALAFYVLNERIPIFPAARNANQIFPLAACENYMLDFTVSPRTVNSYFGRRD